MENLTSNSQVGERKWTGFNTFTVVALCILWLFEVSAVAPALGPFAQAFPEATPFQIRMVMSMPFISVCIFTIISGGVLARHFDTKKIIIVGLIIYGVSGVLPAFASSVPVILALRLLTGIGAGLIIPHSNIIISRKFTGEKRKRLLGLNNSVANFAYVGLSFLVSALLILGWQGAFYAFFFVFVILILVIVGLPSLPPNKEPRAEGALENGGKVQKEKLPKSIFGLALLMAYTFALFGFVPTNISVFVVHNNLAPIWAIGIIMAVTSAAGIVTSIMLPEFVKLFRRYLISFSLLCSFIGFFVLYYFPSLTGVLVGEIFCGLAMTGLLPAVLFEMTAANSSFAQRDAAYGLVNSFIYLGSFASPFLQSLVSIIGSNDSIEFVFLSGGVIMLVAAIISLIVAVSTKGRPNSQAVH